MEWNSTYSLLCRVCAAVISDQRPVSWQGHLGGFDLNAIAYYCSKVWVWEKPEKEPGWVPVLGWLPAVSIHSISTGSSSKAIYRCTLLITIAELERRVGRLFQCTDDQSRFDSGSGVDIYLVGFHEGSLQAAREAAVIARTMTWAGNSRLVSPDQRFGSQRPSKIIAASPKLFSRAWQFITTLADFAEPASIDVGLPGVNAEGRGSQRESLGHIINGSDLGEDCLGLMVELF
jgi:hypothetical protein